MLNLDHEIRFDQLSGITEAKMTENSVYAVDKGDEAFYQRFTQLLRFFGCFNENGPILILNSARTAANGMKRLPGQLASGPT